MFLVGTLAGVAAVIAGYPVYGGQALRCAAAAMILLAVALARRLPPARLTPRDVLLLAALAAVGMCFQRVPHRGDPGRQPDHDGHGRRRGARRPRDRRPRAHRIAGGHRRPSARVVAAGGVIVAGAALTTGLGTGSLRGLLFASGALACEVGFSQLAMPLLSKLGPIRVSGYAAAAAVPMALAAGKRRRAPHAPCADHGEAAGLAYLAVVVSAGAFVLWYAALPRPGAGRAGPLAGIVPIGAIVTTVTSASATPPVPTSPAPLWSPPGSSSG